MPPSSMMSDWARHLLAYGTTPSTRPGQTQIAAALLVYEKLRQQLSAPIGMNGFQALASRALTLARSEAPCLNVLQITEEGCLRILDEDGVHTDPDQNGDVGVIFIAHLLGLLLTFLGTATTRQLMQDVFPNLESQSEAEGSTPFEGILQEVHNLRSVSETLHSLADEHPAVEDGLRSISENVRDIATILDVFAVVRNASDAVRQAELHRHSRKYLM